MRRIVVVLLLLTMCVGSARAHESRPLTVRIDQVANQSYIVTETIPLSVPEGNRPEIKLLPPCHPHENEPGIIPDALFVCDKDGQVEVSIVYPLFNPALSTVVIFDPLEGSRRTVTLRPEENRWLISSNRSFLDDFLIYIRIGFEHILVGMDHLLFLVLLIVITSKTPWQLFGMISGFTLAHSVTLGLSTLGVVSLHPGAVESLIALSIVVLAAEILRGNKATLTWRKPILVTCLFGLIHGLGFAEVLKEVGLEDTQMLASLAGFNVGVEFGQIVFVCLVMLLMWIVDVIVRLMRLPPQMNSDRMYKLVTWPVGLIATVWTVERVSASIG